MSRIGNAYWTSQPGSSAALEVIPSMLRAHFLLLSAFLVFLPLGDGNRLLQPPLNSPQSPLLFLRTMPECVCLRWVYLPPHISGSPVTSPLPFPPSLHALICSPFCPPPPATAIFISQIFAVNRWRQLQGATTCWAYAGRGVVE